ncbi:hypothetical protein DFA_09693 [Cavenderia fasciculata]|uniref:EGF-like domain-containing protein n=1 Tax=Cavenderia fasciculata TaxID=261658 RepID=F4Q8C1_CACFS|nr:uncharacterized protein DFA_09693 [Cavenderia fasciculata]EGG16021.1 hypothetical protein DFA_09693 [Cavenderia fasciculata]|eukprot:XP_004352346.1 hypothetical protein DFA_09693 [Cavenderia fasciculata]
MSCGNPRAIDDFERVSFSQLSTNIIILSIITIVLSLINVTTSALQGAELYSAIWLIQQLGLPTIPLDANRGSPSTSLAQFTFPEVTDIVISSQVQVKDSSMAILDRIKSLPKLTLLSVQGDHGLINVQSDFPFEMPLLKQVTLAHLANCLSIPTLMSDGTAIEGLVLSGAKLASVNVFGQSSLLPNLLSINLELTPVSVNLLSFYKTSFPKLNSVIITLLSAVKTNIQIRSTTITDISFTTRNILPSQGGFDIDIEDPINVASLYVMGGSTSTLTPSSLDSYPNIGTAILAIPLSSFPMTNYPPKATIFTLSQNTINTIPNIPIPSIMTKYGLTYSTISAQFPQTIFDNLQGAEIDFSNNPNLSGTVPDSLCKNRLILMNSPSITKIPAITIDNTTIITIFSKGNITGNNIGFGNYGSNLAAVIPNKQILYSSPTVNYLLTTVELSLSGVYDYKYNFSFLEAGINIWPSTAVQTANNVEVSFPTILTYNPNLTHNISLSSVSPFNPTPIKCYTTSSNPTVKCSTNQGIKSDNYTITIYNQYYQTTLATKINFKQSYPKLSTIVSPGSVKNGSQITINGSFGNSANLGTVVFNNITTCAVISKSTNRVICNLTSVPSSGSASIRVTVDGFVVDNDNFVSFTSLKSQCELVTNFCSGNGVCNDDGICICQSPAFYNDCSKRKTTSKSYPLVTDYIMDQKNITMLGDYGPFGQTSPTVTIAGQTCVLTFINQTQIKCYLDPIPNANGYVTLVVTVDGVSFISEDMAFIFGGSTSFTALPISTSPLSTTSINTTASATSSSTTGSATGTTSTATTTSSDSTTGSSGDTPQVICQRTTYNCFGHGQCNVQGICQCNQDFNPVDNCRTQFINTTITPNETNPTVSFDIDGIDFSMEFYSIQELDQDDRIKKELFVNMNQWIVNMTTDNITTTVDYSLNITNYNTSVPGYNPYKGVTVSSTISFSSIARDISFANQVLNISPYSIKQSVSINGWIYSSNVATLRVVFLSTITNNQTTTFGCDQLNVDSFQYDNSIDSIQYLRVVKDNIQFNGRFIEYAVADNSSVISRTKLISLTPLNETNLESIAMIGVNLPQCQSCVLDPDFSPLLVDKGSQDDCDSKSNTWRIIVGCVVGGFAAIAITVTSTLLYKKKKIFKRNQREMKRKLNNF